MPDQELPPINDQSTLLSVQPDAPTLHASGDATSTAEPFLGCAAQSSRLDTSDLYNALTRSQQIAGRGTGGMRRATSAPHSMDLYLMMHQQEEQTRSPARANESELSAVGCRARQGQAYLTPSGGPMRRAASSLSMRRSSSFLWTPAAHHDFERAVHFLSDRGADVSASAIAQLMTTRHVDLKVADVDKHMRKKFIVQRRIMQQLLAREPLAPTPIGTANGRVTLDGRDEIEPTSSPTGGLSGGGLLGYMAAVNEEATAHTGSEPPLRARASSLTDQIDRQRAAHQQLSQMQEQMLAGEED